VMWYPGDCEFSHVDDYTLTDLDVLGTMCQYNRGISPATCSSMRGTTDYFWWNNANGYSAQAVNIGGLSIPLTGAFDGNGPEPRKRRIRPRRAGFAVRAGRDSNPRPPDP